LIVLKNLRLISEGSRDTNISKIENSYLKL